MTSCTDTVQWLGYMKTDMPELDPRRRRLLFRATHRGTQETDRLIGGFVAPRLAGFTDAELDAIEAIMDLPDVDLADWLMGRLAIPPEADSPMLRAIRAAAMEPNPR
jgi:antitoxin CptB